MADRRPNIASFATADPSTRTVPSSGGRSLSIPSSSFGPRTSSYSGSSNAAPASSSGRSGGSNTPAEPPPTTDCFQCKKRRIACDRGFPTCQKCAKKGLTCPGYKKPKIIWKVLKINQAPETRKFSGTKSEVGETKASKSTGASVPPPRRNFSTLIFRASYLRPSLPCYSSWNWKPITFTFYTPSPTKYLLAVFLFPVYRFIVSRRIAG